MEKDKDPESSARDVLDDSEEEARRIILARRARFVAVALVSAGVTTVACGGQTGDSSSPQPCLSFAATGGTGSAPQVCLGVSASGGAVPCLSIAFTGGAGGVPQPCLSPGGTWGSGGVPQPCLTPIATGGAPQLTDGGPGIPSDAAVDAPRDAMPIPCLTPIPNIPNSGKGS